VFANDICLGNATLSDMSALGRDGPIAARAVIATVFGSAAAIAIGTSVNWRYAPASGWLAAAAVFLSWTWAIIGRMSTSRTASHAKREDPTRVGTHIFLLSASVASLVGVAYLFTAGSAQGAEAVIADLVGVMSVATAWFMVHTIFTVRYAFLYYVDPEGGVDFNQSDGPNYADFAYLAFTIGMTYQVSDTDLKTRAIRSTALRQALLSYLFGAVILAVTVNLIAGLAR
jgi:uncharacterized membrane protein